MTMSTDGNQEGPQHKLKTNYATPRRSLVKGVDPEVENRKKETGSQYVPFISKGKEKKAK